MNKEIKISQLLDVYGKVLKENHFDALDYYYNQDLSLSEIAGIMNLTRQGIWDLIKRSESYLFDLEKNLGLLNKQNVTRNNLIKIQNSAKKIVKLSLSGGSFAQIKNEASRIENTAEVLEDIWEER